MKKCLVLVAAVMLVMGFAMNASAAENYYLFADFTTGNSVFMGGHDVDAYTVSDEQCLLYVNRNGTSVDVYTATLHDTDLDGVIEPNQHPDNIGPDGILGTPDDAVGPMEQRTLAHTTTYSISEIGGSSVSEIYAAADRIYFLDNQSDVSEYIFSSGTVNKVTAASNKYLSHLGRGSDGTWYASNENRELYAYNSTTNQWNHQFTWNGFPGGGHGDGMEVISVEVSPGVQEDHVFVSDMFADNIGEWALVGGAWSEVETYTYPGGGASIVVEGMGAGGFGGHLWATGSGHLYEFGGGALPPENGAPVPEPATMLLLGSGLAGLAGFGRKKKLFKKN